MGKNICNKNNFVIHQQCNFFSVRGFKVIFLQSFFKYKKYYFITKLFKRYFCDPSIPNHRSSHTQQLNTHYLTTTMTLFWQGLCWMHEDCTGCMMLLQLAQQRVVRRLPALPLSSAHAARHIPCGRHLATQRFVVISVGRLPCNWERREKKTS